MHGRDWDARQEGDRLLVRIGDAAFELPLPALAGRHQIDNAGLAVACALALGDLAPDAPALARGLRTVEWPGRLQRLTRGPLVALLPATCELWLDGGHNPAAGEALAASLNRDDPRPLHLVVGMLNTKDEAGFLRPLSTLARSMHTVPVPGEPASRDPVEAAAEAMRLGIPATPGARSAPGAARDRRGRARPRARPDLRLPLPRRARAARQRMTPGPRNPDRSSASSGHSPGLDAGLQSSRGMTAKTSGSIGIASQPGRLQAADPRRAATAAVGAPAVGLAPGKAIA